MEEPGYEVCRTINKEVELDKLWEINTDQEPCITAMDDYHSKLILVHKQAWYNYQGKML